MRRFLRSPTRSITAKIAIAFFLASSIPMVIGLAAINNAAHKQAKLHTEKKLIELVDTREDLLEEHIASMERLVSSLAAMPSVIEYMSELTSGEAVEDTNVIRVAQELATIQETSWGRTHHVFLSDPDGNVVLSPPARGWSDPGLTLELIEHTQGPHFGQSIADAESFEHAKSAPTVSGFFGFEERDHYHQLAMCPVRSSTGDTLGVVAIEIDIQSTIDLLCSDFKLGESGRIELVTTTGERVVHLKGHSAEIPHITPGLRSAMTSGQVSSGNFNTPNGAVLGVYKPSSVYPWIIAVEFGQSEVIADARAQQARFTVVGLVIILVCAITAIILARYFSKPIQSLVESATAVAQGDLFRKIEITSDDEIGQLQHAVDDMRSSLKQQIDKLDCTVVERTEQLVKLNETLRYDSQHDKLTGLANRELFSKALACEIEEYHNDMRRKFAVLFFDFDRFKLVNDSLGHAAGDALLCSIADRFRSTLRSTELAARFGGDEFVVVLAPIESEAQAYEAANRLLKVFEEPHDLDGHQVTSTASIGLVMSDDRYTNPDDIIRDADAAMYQAKLDGKGRVVGFDHQMHENAKLRLRLEEDLYKAIEKGQLRVAYQPIIDLVTLETRGFEALIRWEHPELGMISPDRFINIAEDTGQIVPIGSWVLERAVQDIMVWNSRRKDAAVLSVNVNVSKRQIIDDSFVPNLKALLDWTQLNPEYLKIEVTESTIVDPRSSEPMIGVFDAIREMGVQIAMDDFGTGHSSLSLLHNFQFDVLKVDRSFINNLELNRDIGAVLHAIIELAHNSGMTIVAEGVETQSQVTALLAHGCDMVQGYFFAKPMPGDQIPDFLDSEQTTKRAA